MLDEGITLQKFQQLAQKKYDEMYKTTSTKPAASTTTTEAKTVYQVVCGSFSDRKNAENRVKELKAKGFDSFLQVKK